MLTARANWAAEPIRRSRRVTALKSDEAHKDGRPAATPFEALICKNGGDKQPMRSLQPVSCLFHRETRGGGRGASPRTIVSPSDSDRRSIKSEHNVDPPSTG